MGVSLNFLIMKIYFKKESYLYYYDIILLIFIFLILYFLERIVKFLKELKIRIKEICDY